MVEVPCLVDGNGVQGCYVGDLPEQLAAITRTNINVQLMTLEAAATGKRDAVYQAAMLDPHTGSELTLDQIRALCDDMIAAHGMESMFPSSEAPPATVHGSVREGFTAIERPWPPQPPLAHPIRLQEPVHQVSGRRVSRLRCSKV